MPTPQKRPPLLNEVIKTKTTILSGILTIPTEHDGYTIGTVCTTADAAKNWAVLEHPLYEAGEFNETDTVFHEGHIWESTEDTNSDEPTADSLKWKDLGEFEANGILAENAKETGKYAFLVTGEVREKHLKEYDPTMAHSLFKNKILLK